jgi:cobalt-zinc-cadmium efflux system protein
MAGDAAISLGVLLAGLVVMYTGWSWLDPLVSVGIVVLITWSTWLLLAQSLRMMLAAVPDNIDHTEIETFLRARPGVSDMHDLHIWPMSTTETALTVHLVIPSGYPGDQAIDAITRQLREEFGIGHCTIQVEQGTTVHECCLDHKHA